jgi:Kelch motif/Galactose oxidase, central domain
MKSTRWRVVSSDELRLYRIETTTGTGISEKVLPCDRSAHNMVSLNDGSVLVFAGEDNTGRRYSDVWKLHVPSRLYSVYKYDQLDRLSYPVWELLQCTKIANEDVPTARSNGAAVLCGDYMIVFGGWGQASQCLDHGELLHLETLCWTHCSTRNNNSSQRPCPRGNPTLVYSEKLNSAILFGGWTRRTDLATYGGSIWTLGNGIVMVFIGATANSRNGREAVQITVPCCGPETMAMNSWWCLVAVVWQRIVILKAQTQSYGCWT